MPGTVSILRLNLLRAMYLFMAVGLGAVIWPGIVAPPAGLGHTASVVRALLGAVGLLALLGLRHPLAMLPLLLFELTWKVIWVGAFALPLWLDGSIDAARLQSLYECLLGLVLLPLVIPWRYVLDTYLRAPAERWRSAAP